MNEISGLYGYPRTQVDYVRADGGKVYEMPGPLEVEHVFVPDAHEPDRYLCKFQTPNGGTCGSPEDDLIHVDASMTRKHAFIPSGRWSDEAICLASNYGQHSTGTCGKDRDDPSHIPCPHDNIDREPTDRAVGIMTEGVRCVDCGEDLSDDPEFERDYEGDRADEMRDH